MQLHSLDFCVAELFFRLSAPNTEELKQRLPSYAPFYIRQIPEHASMIFEARIADGLCDLEPEGEEIGQFDSCGTNHAVYRLKEGGYKIIISSPENVQSSAMKTDANFTKCDVSLFGSENNKNFGLGNALMITYAFSAAYHRTLLMHASVTMADGKGYLFLGKSGTGKSTHSGLWLRHIPNTELLNDDNPAVRINDEGRAMVYGTPWSGKTPCYKNKSLPIGAIVRLEQAPRNEINRLSPLHAFSSVLSSCSSMIWDKPSFDAITRTSEAVVKRVSVFFLRCLPDEAAARLCHETVASHTSEKTDAQ